MTYATAKFKRGPKYAQQGPKPGTSKKEALGYFGEITGYHQGDAKSSRGMFTTAFLVSIIFWICGYIAFQMIADISAVKIVNLFGFFLPAGCIIYAFTLTWRDGIHKKFGKRAARVTILGSGIINVVMVVYLWLVGIAPAAPFWPNQAAYDIILLSVPAIVIGSIIAELIAELADTEIYSLVVKVVGRGKPWVRVVVSNLISVPLDTFIFVLLAFTLLPQVLGGQVYPLVEGLAMSFGATIFKWVASLAVLPVIYLVKENPDVDV